jgi:hypothetical protein
LSETVTTHKRFKPQYRESIFYCVTTPTYVFRIMTHAWASYDTSLRQANIANVRERFAGVIYMRFSHTEDIPLK